jgi:hypothetical protein
VPYSLAAFVLIALLRLVLMERARRQPAQQYQVWKVGATCDYYSSYYSYYYYYYYCYYYYRWLPLLLHQLHCKAAALSCLRFR